MVTELMAVEVIYANASQQQLIKLQVPVTCTVEAAIQLSGMLQQFSEIDLAKQSVGIFGQRVTLSTTLHAGDRVEIYRELIVEPMQLRRLKAKRKGK